MCVTQVVFSYQGITALILGIIIYNIIDSPELATYQIGYEPAFKRLLISIMSSTSTPTTEQGSSPKKGTTLPKPAKEKEPTPFTSGSSGSSSSTTEPPTPPRAIVPLVQPHTVQLFGINVNQLGEPPKLKGSNSFDYEDWKKKFIMWGTSRGVYKFINTESTETIVQANSYLKAYNFSEKQIWEIYMQLHERLYGLICLSIYDAMGSDIQDTISSEQLSHKEEKEDTVFSFLEFNSNYLWKKIKQTFEKKAGGATIQCLEELITLRWDEKDNPLQFKQKFDSIIHRFNNIENDEVKPGQKLSEGAKFALVTRALPRRYETIVQAVTTTQTNLSVEHLFTALQRNVDNVTVQRQRHNQGKDSALGFDQSSSSSSSSSDDKSSSHQHQNKPRPPKKDKKGNGKHGKGNNYNNDDKGNPKHQPKTPYKDKKGDSDLVQLPLITTQEYDLLDDKNIHSDVCPPTSITTQFSSNQFALDTVLGNNPVDQDQALRLAEAQAGHFILDTGSSRHITFDKSILCNLTNIEEIRMTGATGHHVRINLMGSVQLDEKVILNNVCYSSNTAFNLLSFALLLDSGMTVSKCEAKIIVLTKNVQLRSGKKIRVVMSFHRVPGTGTWRLKIPDFARKYTVQTRSAFGHTDYISQPSQATSSRPNNNNTKSLTPSTSSATSSSAPNQSDSYNKSVNYFQPNENVTAVFVDAPVVSANQILTFHDNEKDLAKIWHSRLGHQNIQIITQMNHQLNLGISKSQLDNLANCTCDSCIYGKGRATGISTEIPEQHKPTRPLQILFMDLIGWISTYDSKRDKMTRVETMGGNLYALNVVDGFSSYGATKVIKYKSDAAEAAIDVVNNWELGSGKRVERIQVDGGELVSNLFQQFCIEKGIRLTITTRDHPQHNGKVERRNGILKEMVRSMFAHSCVPTSLWGEAILYATFIYNNSVQPSIQNQIPNQVLFNKTSSAKNFKVFGCDAYVLLDQDKRGAFDARYRLGMFVGINEQQNCYRVLKPGTNTVINSRDVKFIETSFKVAQSFDGDRNYSDLPVVFNNYYLPQQPSTVASTQVPSNTESIPVTLPKLPVVQQPVPITNPSNLSTNSFSPSRDPGSSTSTVIPVVIPTIPVVIPPIPVSISNNEMESKHDTDEPMVQQTTPKSRIEPPARATAAPHVVSSVPISSLSSLPFRKVLGVSLPPPSTTVKPPTSTSTASKLSARKTRSRTVRNSVLFLDENDELYDSVTAGLFSNDDTFLSVQSPPKSVSIPETYKQAINSEDKDKWIIAMNEELFAHQVNNTWSNDGKIELNHKPISARWVYAIKMDERNNPTRYKARLVARGFEQVHGIDFDETYAPVTKINSIKLLLSVAADQDLEIKQLDFDTAFLNARLDHTVYLTLPPGTGQEGQVVKLIKSLYGLKQAGHDWHELIAGTLIQLGYTRCKTDNCLFIKHTTDGRKIYLCLYVDDTSIFYDKKDEAVWLTDKASIASTFKIKDIGDCKWFLNMELQRDRVNGTITLSQSAYTQKMLKRFDLVECRPTLCPLVDIDLYNPPEAAKVDQTLLSSKEQNYYQQIIGSLNYAAMITRPDIAFAVNELSRFNAQAKAFHLQAAKHVLRYLAGTVNLGLKFTKLPQSNTNNININSYSLQVFTDASWANDSETRRSTSGTLIKFNGNATYWSSKKQKTVAKSSTEAEYVAASESVSDIIWLKMWMMEVLNISIQVTLLCDNQSALAIAKNDKDHQRTKHIDIAYHFIREQVTSGNITLRFIPGKEEEADLLTKRHKTSADFKARRDVVVSTV